MSDSTPVKEASLAGQQFARSPVLYVLVIVAFVKWFVFFGISMHFGGDSLHTIPSRDGFVLTSHGHKTPVSESVWLFCLIYPYCTLMLSPAIVILFAIRQKALRSASTIMRVLVVAFVCLWVFGWYGSITRAFLKSLHDYQNLKRSNAPIRANAAPNNLRISSISVSADVSERVRATRSRAKLNQVFTQTRRPQANAAVLTGANRAAMRDFVSRALSFVARAGGLKKQSRIQHR